MSALQVERYQTRSGQIPFTEWLLQLNDAMARARISNRIDRLSDGSLGDWRSVGGGVFELRIEHGPGYRVYYGQAGMTLVLLLCGGTKSRQNKDIDKAHAYWQDYKRRPSEQPMASGRPSQE